MVAVMFCGIRSFLEGARKGSSPTFIRESWLGDMVDLMLESPLPSLTHLKASTASPVTTVSTTLSKALPSLVLLPSPPLFGGSAGGGGSASGSGGDKQERGKRTKPFQRLRPPRMTDPDLA